MSAPEPLGFYYNVFATVSVVFGVILGMIMASSITANDYNTRELLYLAARLFCLAATVLAVMQFGAAIVIYGWSPKAFSLLPGMVTLIIIQPLGSDAVLINASIWYALMIAWVAAALLTAVSIRIGMGSERTD